MVPTDAIRLEQEGFFVHVTDRESGFGSFRVNGKDFRLYREGMDSSLYVCHVNKPLAQNYRAADAEPDEARISVGLSRQKMGPGTTRAISEILVMAANQAVEWNLDPENAKRLEAQRAERDRIRAEQALLRQRDDEQYLKLYNQVIWLVGSKFRLRRRGKRATVFGTIAWVSPPNEVTGNPPSNAMMRTISEKDVPMKIMLRDVIKMEIKQDGSDRRYDLIYEEEVKSAHTQPA